jgi:hypothetical protein
MPGPQPVDEIRRCPSCGALVSADATWCGQCYATLEVRAPAAPVAEPRPPAPMPDPPTAGPGVSSEGQPAPPRKAEPTWPCPVCGNDNPIELDGCSVCGTPFAALMRAAEKPPPVEPRDALIRSLIYPGLGHRRVGRPADGLARGVLFGVLLALTLLLGTSGLGSATLVAAFALYAILTVVVYAGSAVEAYRLAEGGDVLVSSRALLWTTVGVILVSVGMIALSLVGAVRR